MKNKMIYALILLSGLIYEKTNAQQTGGIIPGFNKFNVHTPAKLTGQIYKPVFQEAREAIDNYFKAATAEDKKNFAEYLRFYRSAGGYQVVTPAPASLLKNLSPQAKALFAKLKELAQSYTQPRVAKPGATTLTLEGEKFWESIRKYVVQKLETSLKK